MTDPTVALLYREAVTAAAGLVWFERRHGRAGPHTAGDVPYAAVPAALRLHHAIASAAADRLAAALPGPARDAARRSVWRSAVGLAAYQAGISRLETAERRARPGRGTESPTMTETETETARQSPRLRIVQHVEEPAFFGGQVALAAVDLPAEEAAYAAFLPRFLAGEFPGRAVTAEVAWHAGEVRPAFDADWEPEDDDDARRATARALDAVQAALEAAYAAWWDEGERERALGL